MGDKFEGTTLEKDKPTDFTEPAVVTLTLTHPDSDVLVVAFWKQAWGLMQYAEGLVIATGDDMKPAIDSLAVISKLKKAVEVKRKEYLQPFKEHIDEVNLAFKRLLEPILAADTITRDKMIVYNLEQERIRREQEEINRKRMEAAEAEMRLKGELSESVNLVEVTPEAPKTVKGDFGSAGMTDHWKYEVFDFALVPDDYKMINTGVLTPVVKASKGKITIPGIRIFNEPFVSVRAR